MSEELSKEISDAVLEARARSGNDALTVLMDERPRAGNFWADVKPEASRFELLHEAETFEEMLEWVKAYGSEN